jgi:hypothetical protein
MSLTRTTNAPAGGGVSLAADNTWTGTQRFVDTENAIQLGEDLIVRRVDGFAAQRWALTSIAGSEKNPFIEINPVTGGGADPTICGYQLYRLGRGDAPNREFSMWEARGTTGNFNDYVIGVFQSGTGQLRPLRFKMGAAEKFSLLTDGNLEHKGRLTFENPDNSAPILVRRNDAVDVQIRRHDATADAPRLLFSKTRGTIASPTAPASGDRLGDVLWSTNTAAGAIHNGGLLRMAATQAWTLGSAHGTKAQVFTTPNGTATLVESLTVEEPADGETALLLRRNVGGTLTLQRVSMGAADSAGTGFKVLRVPN